MDPELQKYLKTLSKTAIVLMVLLAIYLLFQYVFPLAGKILAHLPVLFLPFIFAILLAVIIEPVVNFFEKKARLNRVWSVVISLILVVGGFISLLSLLVSRIINDMSRLYPQVLYYSDQITANFMEAIGDLKLFYLSLNLSPQVQNALQQNLENGMKLASSLMERSINGLIRGLSMLPGILIFLMIATVATFFIIKDRALIRSFVMQWIPGNARSKTREVFAELFRVLVGFVKAYGILITVTTIVTMVALRVLGVDYVITIGIIVGLLDILPVLGPGAVFIPWFIWHFVAGDLHMGIGLLVIYLLISVVRQFLEPKIVGDSIGLHPLATLISLYAGLQLGGIGGMIMGPILLVILIAGYRAGLFDSLNWRKK